MAYVMGQPGIVGLFSARQRQRIEGDTTQMIILRFAPRKISRKNFACHSVAPMVYSYNGNNCRALSGVPWRRNMKYRNLLRQLDGAWAFDGIALILQTLKTISRATGRFLCLYRKFILRIRRASFRNKPKATA